MSRTRLIYFLSAIVLIIGCFALNTSYSLFIDNDTSSIVDTIVPEIDVNYYIFNMNSTETTGVEVEAGESNLVGLVVENKSNIDINYAINVTSDSNTYKAQKVKMTPIEDGVSQNSIETETKGVLTKKTTDIKYFALTNTGYETITVNFEVNTSYATVQNTLTSNIEDEEVYEVIPVADIPYSHNTETLAYHLIKKQVDTYNNIAENNIDDFLPENYFPNENKINLPITIETELNVDSLTSYDSDEVNEMGLFKTDDDYGISYYYRGASSVNYVSFAGFIWRIVRINGDGSIRLILNGSFDSVKHIEEDIFIYENDNLLSYSSDGAIAFNTSSDDNMYVGYMYGSDQTNKTASLIKEYIDLFYENYMVSYENYLADVIFCGDKTFSGNGTGTGTTYYAAYQKFNKNVETSTLKCATAELPNISSLLPKYDAVIATYSRYTANQTTATDGETTIEVNDNLDYPIALLSAEEYALLGSGFFDEICDQLNWWTISPYLFNGAAFNYSRDGETSVQDVAAVIPVINLKSNILWESGDGTESTPYTVKLNEEA